MDYRKDKEGKGYIIPDLPHIRATVLCGIEYLNFHKDWDWLMPVIEKIEAIDDDGMHHKDGFNIHFFIGKRFTRVIRSWDDWLIRAENCSHEDFEKHKNSFQDYRHVIFDNNKKLSTWQAVVDTIDFINKNNLK